MKKPAIHFRFIFIPILLFAVAIALLSYSEKKETETPLPFLASVDNVVEDQMVKQELYGCAVGVVQNGQIVHVKAYGHFDRLRTKSVTTNSVFRWASLSKPLTAVGVFKAIEEKKLALTDVVSKHVSNWPPKPALPNMPFNALHLNKDKITVAHLLNHRSGVNYYETYKEENYKSPNNFNADQCVDVFSAAALKFIPGTAHLYTTFGYNLLGVALEKATKTPYESYITSKIANKMNMGSLTPYSNSPGGYKKDCNNFINDKNEGNTVWKLPGGGWASNIQDLAKFMQGLINGTFLNNTSALWKSVPNNSSHGFGLVINSLNGETYVGHSGAHDDVNTYLGFFPSSKLGVVVMINADNVGPGFLAKKVQAVFGKNWKLDDLPLYDCGKELKCGDNTVGVWRKTNKADETVIRRGYSTDEFNAEWKWLLDKGYYCADIETYLKGSVRKWDGIFKKTNKKSAMWRNFSQDDFNKKWKEMSDDGYRLIDIETYEDGNTRKWAGLFIEMGGVYALHRNMSHQEMHDKWEDYGKKGLKLIDIERYGNDWAGVWIAGDDVAMYRNFDTDEFRDKRRELNKQGWKLIDVETYMVGSARKWAGLWEKTSVAENYIYGVDFCGWLTTYHNKYDDEGYELIDLETY